MRSPGPTIRRDRSCTPSRISSQGQLLSPKGPKTLTPLAFFFELHNILYFPIFIIIDLSHLVGEFAIHPSSHFDTPLVIDAAVSMPQTFLEHPHKLGAVLECQCAISIHLAVFESSTVELSPLRDLDGCLIAANIESAFSVRFSVDNIPGIVLLFAYAYQGFAACVRLSERGDSDI